MHVEMGFITAIHSIVGRSCALLWAQVDLPSDYRVQRDDTESRHNSGQQEQKEGRKAGKRTVPLHINNKDYERGGCIKKHRNRILVLSGGAQEAPGGSRSKDFF